MTGRHILMSTAAALAVAFTAQAQEGFDPDERSDLGAGFGAGGRHHALDDPVVERVQRLMAALIQRKVVLGRARRRCILDVWRDRVRQNFRSHAPPRSWLFAGRR